VERCRSRDKELGDGPIPCELADAKMGAVAEPGCWARELTTSVPLGNKYRAEMEQGWAGRYQLASWARGQACSDSPLQQTDESVDQEF
jgi:hypothetical protein